VALIERHLLGGVSLLTGSVPSKSIIRTSRLYADMQNAERFGAIVPTGIQENFAAAMERMRRLRARISKYHSAERLRLAGVDLYFGAARFAGPDSISSKARPCASEGADRHGRADDALRSYRVWNRRAISPARTCSI
jgi:pyruvate/2-oxoglutarate dehydrogenase complex dihydrolipoamide dehydrogenase (E3) component